ncbi:putative diphthamide synthesis protein-domain-containing protein [Crucibulum laeve]|uniref:2-(3-amino-3-carboxypropyl)histidine synthase subunit 2 n=1 Tax=Crucibulum laeve TaxID=68775 RepID=A0A5C3LUL8_9AGAR|nr:putative diphthamide synthesis protein-domain-containing protein [Crucibulum laeve]
MDDHSCCVDEVAAQHVDADAMVHYGHACMSLTSRLPVIYVFGRKSLDVDACVSSLVDLFRSNREDGGELETILLRHDVVYTHLADQILAKLRQSLSPFNVPIFYNPIPVKSAPDIKVSTLPSTSTVNSSSDPPSDTPQDSSSSSTIFYIGAESLALTNLLMTHASSSIYSYDPSSSSARLESSRTNRLLMRRYAVVQKARDADVVGILVGTLGVASYLPLITHLRRLLAKYRKKSYTISVGKLNPAKLANFMEIECFVLVACHENSLIEAKDFLRPIVTPYELEVALQAEQSWTGRYVLDFKKLLKENAKDDDADEEPKENEEEEEEEEDPDQPVFSLITGTYRHAKRYGGKQPSSSNQNSDSAMVLRNQGSSVARLEDSAAGQFLQTRTYQGLEVRLGEDAPSVLEQGRSGIARGYQDDHWKDMGATEE